MPCLQSNERITAISTTTTTSLALTGTYLPPFPPSPFVSLPACLTACLPPSLPAIPSAELGRWIPLVSRAAIEGSRKRRRAMEVECWKRFGSLRRCGEGRGVGCG
nr:uncharacterized protein LOC112290522 isoform X1 [Physcomitrium patens]|eukprot:XP_024392635.1 uncharacterized protein LOC112290522 isoform X1 [Physcomitrella patens]